MYNSDYNKRAHTRRGSEREGACLCHCDCDGARKSEKEIVSKKSGSTNSNKMMNVFIARYCYTLTYSRMHAHSTQNSFYMNFVCFALHVF